MWETFLLLKSICSRFGIEINQNLLGLKQSTYMVHFFLKMPVQRDNNIPNITLHYISLLLIIPLKCYLEIQQDDNRVSA